MKSGGEIFKSRGKRKISQNVGEMNSNREIGGFEICGL